MEVIHHKKPMSAVQAQVMRLIRKGHCLVPYIRRTGKKCFRVLDAQRSPVMNIQERTQRALSSSERIVKAADGHTWIANPIKRFSSPTNKVQQ